MKLSPTEQARFFSIMKSLVSIHDEQVAHKIRMYETDVQLLQRCRNWFHVVVFHDRPVAITLTREGFEKLKETFPEFRNHEYDPEENEQALNEIKEMLAQQDPESVMAFFEEQTAAKDIDSYEEPEPAPKPVKIPSKKELTDKFLDELAVAMEKKDEKLIAELKSKLATLNG
jgi:hypothetical protein